MRAGSPRSPQQENMQETPRRCNGGAGAGSQAAIGREHLGEGRGQGLWTELATDLRLNLNTTIGAATGRYNTLRAAPTTTCVTGCGRSAEAAAQECIRWTPAAPSSPEGPDARARLCAGRPDSQAVMRRRRALCRGVATPRRRRRTTARQERSGRLQTVECERVDDGREPAGQRGMGGLEMHNGTLKPPAQ